MTAQADRLFTNTEQFYAEHAHRSTSDGRWNGHEWRILDLRHGAKLHCNVTVGEKRVVMIRLVLPSGRAIELERNSNRLTPHDARVLEDTLRANGWAMQD